MMNTSHNTAAPSPVSAGLLGAAKKMSARCKQSGLQFGEDWPTDELDDAIAAAEQAGPSPVDERVAELVKVLEWGVAAGTGFDLNRNISDVADWKERARALIAKHKPGEAMP